jgi:hypothetical protein
MADRRSEQIEIGRIVFRSWEHRWQTDEPETHSVAAAKRLLPESLTAPIYKILGRWENDLLRTSLPYRPYGLRIRPAGSNWIEVTETEELLFEHMRRALKLNHVCAGWDAALPVPPTRTGKYGTVYAPDGDQTISDAYWLGWRVVTFPAEVSIDQLLGKFSPRYKEPSPFPHIR